MILESANVLASEVLGPVDVDEPHDISESVLFVNNVPHGTSNIQTLSQQNLADTQSIQDRSGISSSANLLQNSEVNVSTTQTTVPLVIALADTSEETTPEIPTESHTTVSAGEGIVVTPLANGTSAENYVVSLSPEVKTQIQTNSDGIEQLSGKVTTNESNIATNREAIKKLDSRVGINETGIETNKDAIEKLDKRVGTNETGIETNKDAIEKLDERVGNNETGIATNKEAIKKLDGRVGANETGIATNKEAIKKLDGRVGANETGIATNKNDIKALDGNLTKEKQERIAADLLLNEKTQNIQGTAGQTTITGNTSIGGSLVVGDAASGSSATINNGSLVLTNGGRTINVDPTSGTITGLSNQKWDWNNIKDDRVATEGQLKSIANSALTISSDNGRHVAKLASEFKFTGGPNLEIQVSDDPGNTSNGQVFFKVKDNPSFESVKTGTTVVNTNGIFLEGNDKTVQLTSEGLDNGGNRLTNIGRAVENSDAVTLEQLNDKTNYQFVAGDPHTKVDSKWSDDIRGTVVSISVEHPEMTLYQAGNGLKMEELASDGEGKHQKFSVLIAPGEKNLKVNEEGLSLNPVLTFGQNSLTLDGDKGFVYLKNVTWDPVNNYEANRAATESQLLQLSQKGWIADADQRTSDSGTISLGSTLSIKGDGGNISTYLEDAAGGNKLLTIRLDQNPTFESITSKGPIYSKYNPLTSWTSEINKDKWQSGEFPNSIADLISGNNSNIVVTQGQLYDAIRNLNNADRHITEGSVADIGGDDGIYQITLKQNNHANIVLDIPKISGKKYETGIDRDIILAKDPIENQDHLDNWTATEREIDPATGNIVSSVTFSNTTLDRSTSGTVKKEGGIATGDTINPGDIDSSVVLTKDKKFGRDFVVSDTAGNRITIGDIASANKLADVSSIVDDHTESIDFLSKGFVLKTDGSERNDAVKAGQTVAMKTDGNILVDKYISENDPDLHYLSFAVNPDLSIETLTVQKKDKDGNPVPNSTKIQLTNSGVLVNGDAYISSGGLNANGKPITNVPDTEEVNFSPDNKNALNIASFYKTYEKVDKGFIVNGNSGGTWTWDSSGKELKIIGGLTVSLKEEVNKNEDGSYISNDRTNITTSIDGNSLSISLISEPRVDSMTIGIVKDKLIHINPNGKGYIEGLQNIDWDLETEPYYMQSAGTSRAATEKQIFGLQKALIKNGTQYIGDDDKTVRPTLKEKLSLLGGATEGNATDGNIWIESFVDDEHKTQGLRVKLANKIGLKDDGSISIGEKHETKLNKQSLIFAQDPSSSQGKETQVSLTGMEVVDRANNDKTALYNLSGLKVSNDGTGTPLDLEFSTSRINANDQVIQGVASALKAKVQDDGSVTSTLWPETKGNENLAANLGDVIALRTQLTTKTFAGEVVAPEVTEKDNPLLYKGGNIQLALSTDENGFGQLTYDIKLNNVLKLGPTETQPSVVIDGSGTRTNPIYVNEGNKGDIRGLSNTTWNDDYAKQVNAEKKGRAATEEQLLQVSKDFETEIGKGLNFQGDVTTESFGLDLGETLRVYGGSKEKATTDDNILVTQVNNQLHVQLAEKLKLGQNGVITFGSEQYKLSHDGLILNNKASYLTNGFVLNIDGGKKIELTTTNISMGDKQIHDVAAGTAKTDAVNVSQLEQYTSDHQTKVEGGSNITVTPKKENDVPVYTVDLNNQVVLGQKADGTGSNGEAGSLSITDEKGQNKVEIGVNDKGGHLKIESKDQTTSADISVSTSEAEGTRLNYVDEENKSHTVATTTDGLIFQGDKKGDVVTKTDKIALNDTLNINGDNNITTKAGGNGIEITLNENIDLGENGSVTIGNVSIENNSVAVGDNVSITDNGIKVGGVSVTVEGIDAGGKKITNVAAGTEDSDAVNYGQLKDFATKHQVEVNSGQNVTVVQKTVGTDDEKHTSYTVNLNNNVVLGTKGKDDEKGESGSLSITNDQGSHKVDIAVGADDAGHITIAGNKEDISANITVTKDGNNSTRLSYESKDKDEKGQNITYQVATTQDGISFGAGDGNASQKVNLEKGSFNVKGDANDNSPEANVVTKLEKLENGDVTVTVSLKDDLNAHSLILKDTNGTPESPQYGALSFIAMPDGTNGNNKDVAGNEVSRLQFNGQHLATLDDGMQYGADNADKVINLKHNNKLSIVGDQTNITTESDGAEKIAVKLNDDIAVKTVKVGDNVSINNYGFTIGATGPNQIEISENNIYMGGKQIHGVAPGTKPDDAVNVSQLNQVGGQILSKINDVDKRAKAGIAQAIATAGLPQAYLPGKNLMAASTGTFGGQTAFAVGISSISDDGKWIIKGTFSGNTQSKFGGSVGVGYQW